MCFFQQQKLCASPTAQSEHRKSGHSALGSGDNDHKNARIWDKEENHKQTGQRSMAAPTNEKQAVLHQGAHSDQQPDEDQSYDGNN